MNPALNPETMTKIMIPVTVGERELLKQAAKMNLREPREQARFLLRDALCRHSSQVQVQVQVTNDNNPTTIHAMK